MKTLSEVRWEHYDIRYRNNGNVWGFLGNGRVEAEVLVGQGKLEGGEEEVCKRLAPYLRNEDVPFEI